MKDMTHNTEVLIVSEREWWLKLHFEGGLSMVELAQRSSFARSTLYLWKDAYEKDGLAEFTVLKTPDSKLYFALIESKIVQTSSHAAANKSVRFPFQNERSKTNTLSGVPKGVLPERVFVLLRGALDVR